MNAHTSAKGFWRFLRRVLVALLALLVLTVVAVALLVVYERRQAENLIRDLAALKIGQSTELDAERLANRYGGIKQPGASQLLPSCVGIDSKLLEPGAELGREARSKITPETNYSFHVGSDWLFALAVKWNFLQLIGIRPWDLLGAINVRGARVGCFTLRLWLLRSDEFLLLWSARAGPEVHQIAPVTPPYVVSRGHFTGARGESIDVEIAPAASLDDSRRAFEVNFACLAGWKECRHACEVAPSAWVDGVELRKKMDWIASSDENEPRCQEILRSHQR